LVFGWEHIVGNTAIKSSSSILQTPLSETTFMLLSSGQNTIYCVICVDYVNCTSRDWKRNPFSSVYA